MSSKHMTGCFQAEEMLLVSTAVGPERRVRWNIQCSGNSFSSSIQKGPGEMAQIKNSRLAGEVGKKFSTVRAVRPWHRGCVE